MTAAYCVTSCSTSMHKHVPGPSRCSCSSLHQSPSQGRMSCAMQVNCFVLSITTIFNNRLAVLGLQLQNKRSISSQRRQQQEGLKFPWRRKPAQIASDSPRSVCATLHVCTAADYNSTCVCGPVRHHPSSYHIPLPPFSIVCLLCRVSAASAACQEAIEQGLAAEHRLDMRLAVHCFEVNLTSVLPATPFRTDSWLLYLTPVLPAKFLRTNSQLLQLFTSTSVLVMHTSTL